MRQTATEAYLLHRFVDRDMFMQFRGGGVGHTSLRPYTRRMAEDCHLPPQCTHHRHPDITPSGAEVGGMDNGDGKGGEDGQDGEDEERGEEHDEGDGEDDGNDDEGEGASDSDSAEEGEALGEDKEIMSTLGYGAL